MGCIESNKVLTDNTVYSVQFVELKNDGAYHVSFYVTNQKYQTDPTEYIGPICNDSKKIDLAQYSFKAGDELTLVINQLAGKSLNASVKVIVALNGCTALYVSSGILFIPKISNPRLIMPKHPPQIPPGWPEGLIINKIPFTNWDNSIQAANL